jgi:hypothetical protein
MESIQSGNNNSYMINFFKMINKAGQVITLWVLFVTLILCTGSKSLAQIENDTLIFWSKSRPLTSQDFQGVVPSSKFKTNEVANIYSSISSNGSSLNYSIPEYKILVFYLKRKSWKKPDFSLSELNHEQTHFDITELYGRKIRALIQKLNDQNIKDLGIYEKEINDLYIEKKKTDYIYDSETRNGRDLLKQKAWDEKIAKELETLKEYEVDYSEYIDE